MAVGTVTITEERHGVVKKIKFAWTSGTDAEEGTASGTTTYAYNGEILELATDPGSTAPTDDYDITITDEDGLDVLTGSGADRDTANTEYVRKANLGVVANDKLTINVSGAGSAKTGAAYLFVR